MAKKVYELAQELGIGALDLVERLKASGLNVRNHMASLSDADLERFFLGQEPPVTPKPKLIVKRADGSIREVMPATTAQAPLDWRAIQDRKIRESIETKRREQQQQRSHLEELFRNEDYAALFGAFAPSVLIAEAKALGLALPSRIEELCQILLTNDASYERCPKFVIDPQNWGTYRRQQLDSQLEREKRDGKLDTRRHSVQVQAVSAEVAFEEFLKHNGIEYVDLNRQHSEKGASFWPKQDFVVRGDGVDVKARTNVTGWTDPSLSAKSIESDEVVPFVHCSESYGEVHCSIIGVFDGRNAYSSRGKLPFYNPCLFAHIGHYYGVAESTRPPVDELVWDFTWTNHPRSAAVLSKHYGAQETLARTMERMPTELHAVARKIGESHANGQKAFLPRVIFEWIVADFKRDYQALDLDKWVFPFCCLNEFQHRFLLQVLTVAESCSKYKCVKSGVPLSEGHINHRYGVIYSQVGDVQNRLFAYSSVDASALFIHEEEKVARCTVCGCLVHKSSLGEAGWTKCPAEPERLLKRIKSN